MLNFFVFFQNPVLQNHEAPRTKFSINVFRRILISVLLNFQILEVSMQITTCTKLRKVCQFHILSIPKENILRLLEAQRSFPSSPTHQEQSLDKEIAISHTYNQARFLKKKNKRKKKTYKKHPSNQVSICYAPVKTLNYVHILTILYPQFMN